jgi:signal peptidase I
MNPSGDVGASEILANLSIGMVVLIALVLTVLRLYLLYASKSQSRPGAAPEPPSWARGFAEILESLIVAGVLVFLIIRPFFVQAFYIPSESMENTLMGHDEGLNTATGVTHPDTIHDHIFVSKLVYRYSDPHRGDIIVFRAPKSADMESPREGKPQQENVLIKRLIGLPGDTIEVEDGAVYRNGKRLNEPYIKEPMTKDQTGNPDFGVGKPLKLGPGRLYVMGDNRNDSNDSRYWGTLDHSRVIGKAEVIFWPLNRIRMLN